MASPLVLTVDGHRAPPSDFIKRLEAFDPNLRVVWGLGQAFPFPGWVIERRIPAAMKARVYGAKKERPANQPRYADQILTDARGSAIGGRRYDMMPDWHAVYMVIGEDGKPQRELGEHVIDYLRRNYERTLLGFPELSMKHWHEDHAAQQVAEDKRHDELLDRAARKVMEHKAEIFPEQFAFSRAPEKVKEGTQFYGHDSKARSDTLSDQGVASQDSESEAAH